MPSRPSRNLAWPCIGPALVPVAAAVALLCPQPTSATPPDTVLESALHYVAEAGQGWISDRGCVSCHQVPSMIWAHQAAAASGRASVDREQLDRWMAWSTQVVNFVKPHQKAEHDPVETMAGNIDTMTHLLLAIPAEDSESAWRKTFADALSENQASDGSWRACGQLPAQRRATEETTATTTLWTMLALLQEDHAFDDEKALEFADRVESPESTEYVAVRLLVADRLQKPNRDVWRKRLLAHQNTDGGWGWRIAEPSDALGTGYALYALAKVGGAREAASMARRYLESTQQENGSWVVPGTKKSARGEPTETAIDWATAWAATAIATVNADDP